MVPASSRLTTPTLPRLPQGRHRQSRGLTQGSVKPTLPSSQQRGCCRISPGVNWPTGLPSQEGLRAALPSAFFRSGSVSGKTRKATDRNPASLRSRGTGVLKIMKIRHRWITFRCVDGSFWLQEDVRWRVFDTLLGRASGLHPQIFIDVVYPLLMSIVANAVWDGTKKLFGQRRTPSGGDTTAPTVVNVSITDGDRSLKAVVTTSDEAVAQRAIESLDQVATGFFQNSPISPQEGKHKSVTVWEDENWTPPH